MGQPDTVRGSLPADDVGRLVGRRGRRVRLRGGVVGLFTSGAIDHLFEDASAGFVDTVKAGWDEVSSTGEATGDLASGAWHSIFG
ncbi:hypothetical protein ET475_07035 [Microbacterium protaetiae]|uniref:Uncharacterized protein n=1 Tax=Microbacterium protaetiae TaxID=2509458 RepID=A0A4P6EHZ7_9MICO|nr:hypothetical protein [Microbacterium protaetiae]QAY59767.1 hypothetical protein ET475_07035 [Microbacterium protaetiae]